MGPTTGLRRTPQFSGATIHAIVASESPERPAKYAAVKSGDYLVSRFKAVQKLGTPLT